MSNALRMLLTGCCFALLLTACDTGREAADEPDRRVEFSEEAQWDARIHGLWRIVPGSAKAEPAMLGSSAIYGSATRKGTEINLIMVNSGDRDRNKCKGDGEGEAASKARCEEPFVTYGLHVAIPYVPLLESDAVYLPVRLKHFTNPAWRQPFQDNDDMVGGIVFVLRYTFDAAGDLHTWLTEPDEIEDIFEVEGDCEDELDGLGQTKEEIEIACFKALFDGREVWDPENYDDSYLGEFRSEGQEN